MELLGTLGLSLGLTLVFELGFYTAACGVSGLWQKQFKRHQDKQQARCQPEKQQSRHKIAKQQSMRLNKQDFLLVVLVNILTNPPVVLIYHLCSRYTAMPMTAVVLVLELAAVGVEAAYYKKYAHALPHPLLFSVAANAFSYGIGLLL